MLNGDTKRKIQGARDILVGKIPVPTAQVEQITLALMYKFMSDMDEQAKKLGDKTGFFMGEFEKYSWKNITDTTLSAYDRVALYSEGLEKMNNNPNVPQLFRDIFKGAFLPFKDPETLKLFLDQINEIEYTHSEDLGDAYEYLLSVMGSQGDAGQFRTPRHIIDFIVQVVDPKKEDRILDPACGTAGFLISAYKHILKQNTSKDSKILGDNLSPMDRRNLTKNFVGYDISHEMRRLSLVNMYLHQFSDPQIYEYDTLTSTDHWDEDFDCILANPPFMTPKGGIRPHNRFAVKANRAEVLFVDYIMEHLSTTGKAGIIVPEGIIFQSSNAYKNLRKLLVDDNYLWAVISLPSGVFQPYSGVKTSVLLLDKNIAKKIENILFVNVEGDGLDLSTNRKENDKNDLPEILNSLKKYKELVLNDKEINGEKLFNTNVVGKSRIKESGDYNLSGNRYQSSERGLYIVGKWQEVQLKEICELKKGSSITKKDVKKGSVPVIAGGQNPAYFHNESNRAGETITVSSSGAYSGFVNYFDIPIWASDCTTIKALDNSKISTKYLYYILKFKQSDIYKLQQGMGQPHVYAKDLEKIQIPLLPIEEQKKIVEELDRYQRIIDGARMVIDNWKPEIEVGDVTNFVKLKELANVSSSKRIYQSEYVEEGIPFYRSKEIIELSKGKSITTELFISKERFEEIKSKFGCPQKGDILITAVGSIGDVYVVDLETEFYFKDGNILWLKDVEDSVNPFYLASVLETIVKKDINKLAAGAAYKAMTIEKLKEIEIPIAPMEKQLEIMKYIKENKDFVKKNKLLIKQIKKKQGSIIEQIYGR
jgi:type I restriction enzyme M protein